jgi:DNA anti-recombination protein RmuC
MREYEMSMEEEIKLLVKKVDSLDKRFDAVDKRFDAVDERFDAVDDKFDQMMVRLDENNAIAKLGLEGLQGLRESTDAKFEAAAKNNADQMGLLKSVLVHVRQRVDAPDRPGARRRKS